MIITKVKVFESHDSSWLEKIMNDFLQNLDARQIIKTEYSSAGGSNNNWRFTTIIYYVGIDDIREAKIDNVLEIK